MILASARRRISAVGVGVIRCPPVNLLLCDNADPWLWRAGETLYVKHEARWDCGRCARILYVTWRRKFDLYRGKRRRPTRRRTTAMSGDHGGTVRASYKYRGRSPPSYLDSGNCLPKPLHTTANAVCKAVCARAQSPSTLNFELS